MTISKTWRARVATLAIAGLVLAACGDDDDDAGDTTEEEAAATADDPATADEAAPPTTEAVVDEEEDDGETIQVDDISDIPEECVNLMGDYLEAMEPFVQDVDWTGATAGEMDTVMTDLETELAPLDEQMESAGCDDYDFTDDQASIDAVIELAEDRAPGTVAFLEFVRELSAGFGEDMGDGEAFADLPTDCAGAIAYIEEKMTEADSMMDLPMSDLTALGQVMGTISSSCSASESGDFFTRADVTEFMSGT